MDVPTDIYDADAIEALRRRERLDPERVRRLRNALLKRFASDEEALAALGARASIAAHPLVLEAAVDSALDGATKLLFRTPAALLVEAVILRIASGRSAVCVSSQVGCAAACRFCATGSMGTARSLSTSEILDQVTQAGQRLALESRRLRNVVFMGMGEPFHNEDNVTRAVAALTDPRWFDLSPAKILVSSVGIPAAMVRFAKRYPEVGLALSLHSVDAETRASIIPLAKRYPLEALRAAVGELNTIQNRPVMLEYLLLGGLNDSEADASSLIAWCEGLDVHINLIPYNPIDSAPELEGTAAAGRERFAAQVKRAGLTTTLRRSLGSDITAACGQLVKLSSTRVRLSRG